MKALPGMLAAIVASRTVFGDNGSWLVDGVTCRESVSGFF
jgi:hypothetical protein